MKICALYIEKLSRMSQIYLWGLEEGQENCSKMCLVPSEHLVQNFLNNRLIHSVLSYFTLFPSYLITHVSTIRGIYTVYCTLFSFPLYCYILFCLGIISLSTAFVEHLLWINASYAVLGIHCCLRAYPHSFL